ncbi:MAG: ester cyclase [Deltaproteobacteria bacterium]|nr:ester cyclase [Deltaproteobacteria bacterium]
MMKKTTILGVAIAIFLVGFLCGCGKSKDKSTAKDVELQTETTSNKDAVQMFTNAIEAYNGQDLAALVALFDPAVEWTHKTASKTVIQGRAPLAKHLMNERSTFPDCTIGLRRILADGDDIIVQGVFRATHQGVAHGIKATGNKVGYEFIYFIKVKNNKIMTNIAYLNPAEPLRHMGAIAVEEAKLSEWPKKREVARGESVSKNKDLVKQFYDLWQTNSMDKIEEIVAPGFVLNFRATVSSLEDMNSIKKHMTTVHQEYKKLNFEVESMQSIGAYVVARVVQRGTYRMKQGGADTTADKELEINQAHVFKVEGGKLIELDIYFDELQRYQQFGYSMAEALVQMSTARKHQADAGIGEKAPATVPDTTEEPANKTQ